MRTFLLRTFKCVRKDEMPREKGTYTCWDSPFFVLHALFRIHTWEAGSCTNSESVFQYRSAKGCCVERGWIELPKAFLDDGRKVGKVFK